jgi:hypothetical protein
VNKVFVRFHRPSHLSFWVENAKVLGQLNTDDLTSGTSSTVWVNRNGDIAETISDEQKLLTIVGTKGKAKGKVNPVWVNAPVSELFAQTANSIRNLQAYIDDVKRVGTDETVKVARKGRTSKYPDSIMVRFIPSTVAIPEFDSDDSAVRLYNANSEIIGYNVTPKKREKRVSKSE